MENKVIFRREIAFRMIGDIKLTPRPDGRWEMLVDEFDLNNYNMFILIKIDGKSFFVNFNDVDVIESSNI